MKIIMHIAASREAFDSSVFDSDWKNEMTIVATLLVDGVRRGIGSRRRLVASCQLWGLRSGEQEATIHWFCHSVEKNLKGMRRGGSRHLRTLCGVYEKETMLSEERTPEMYFESFLLCVAAPASHRVCYGGGMEDSHERRWSTTDTGRGGRSAESGH